LDGPQVVGVPKSEDRLLKLGLGLFGCLFCVLAEFVIDFCENVLHTQQAALISTFLPCGVVKYGFFGAAHLHSFVILS